MKLRHFLLLGTLAASLAGCASIRASQRFVTADDIKKSAGMGCPSDNDLSGSPKAGETLGQYRNRIVIKCIKAIDINYDEFRSGLHKESVTSRLVLDILAQGLTSGASIAGKKTAQRLSAGASFVVGSGAAINKDVYYEQTLPALEAIMDARRSKILATIIDAEKKDPNGSSYTLDAAALDLAAYQSAGNLYAAVADLTKTATEAAARAQDNLDYVKGTVDLGPLVPLDPGLVARRDALLGAIDNLDGPTAQAIAGDLKIPVDAHAPLPKVTDLIRNELTSTVYKGSTSDQDQALQKFEGIFRNRGALQ